ncbi:hypothetical protein E5K00_21620 [Hymenobacter aquaticus]|uniref:Glycosyltransferase RgtA/B/C/D-like domain-containing protein n=1 Tax=Hymenobacter aquaticus TaxID=1867101 RepID=A0A4Z0PTG7_9BACT|nr:hypothetical protein [Hymenobacter aquaticus]TGE20596.1 hypothetical protein E5K00_21620 [Hymenobacter aquaticus]
MLSSTPAAAAPSRRAWWSGLALVVLFLLMVQARLWAPYWDTRNVQAILTWDVMGYYLYLPAQFIYHDLSYQKFVADIMREYSPSGSFYQAFQVPGGPAGALVMKYTCGLAVLFTPFFWLGHWAAGLLDYPQDGFSAPYQIAIAFGGLLYALLGLGLLRRVLLRYFSDVVTALVLVLLVLGSNYFQYAVFDGAMAHNYLFTLYALLLWLTIRWHEQPGLKWAAAIGLTLGLMILIRPSEAVAGLIPVLWGVTSIGAARQKLLLALRRWPDVLVAGFFLVLGVLPQLLYWKWATGHFLFYSYQEQSFNFLRPHTYQVLFSYKKGWLLYTPLMVLPLIGMVILWRRNRALAVPVVAYFLINLWVVSAWDIWWYGGSIGQRALVQSYAVLSVPLAYFLTWLLEPQRRRALQMAVAVLVVLLIDLNLFQHWQYMASIIHAEEMNRDYYWAVFNKTKPGQADYALLDVPNRLPQPERDYDLRTLGKLDFENEAPSAENGFNAEVGYYSKQSFHSEAARQYSPALTVRAGDARAQPGQWLRASCQVYSDYGAWNTKLVMSIERDGKNVQWNGMRLQNNLSVNRAWNQPWFYAPVPDDVQPNDVIKVLVLNENGSPSFIDDLQIDLLTPKPAAGTNLAAAQ